MKTQNADTGEIQGTSRHKEGNTWGRSIGALIIVALVVGASLLLFLQMRRHVGKDTQQASPGQWVEVLNGYTVTSLAAAPSNPSVLYACANHAGYTFLRSTDGGTHWQDIGKNVGFIGSCQLAINPADSNELYLVARAESTPNKTTISDVLKHSMDGGQTWSTIVPILRIPGLTVDWHVQRITEVGKQLFGLQLLPLGNTQRPQGSNLRIAVTLSRLVTSVDGGQDWTVVDGQFQAAGLEVRSYAIDPSDTTTIYELVGRSLSGNVPAGGQPVPTSTIFAAPFGADGDLYKTSNGGAQWQLVLKSLPMGSGVQLAPDKPTMIYAGGTISPLPAGAGRSGSSSLGPSSTSPGDVGSFHLHVSSDGGLTWQEISPLPSMTFVQTWFVGTGGRVFGFSGASGSKNTIRSYNPATHTWSEISPPQPAGSLLAATMTKTNGGVALWFQASVGGKAVLYRYS